MEHSFRNTCSKFQIYLETIDVGLRISKYMSLRAATIKGTGN